MTSARPLPQALPSAEEIASARESAPVLSTLIKAQTETQQIQIHDDKGTIHAFSVPTSALRLFVDALTEMSRGHAVALFPIHAELTTQEAADVLGVSRPFLVQLLEKGSIPFHKSGTHQRVLYPDVVAYKNHVDAERRQALDALATQAQELGLRY